MIFASLLCALAAGILAIYTMAGYFLDLPWLLGSMAHGGMAPNTAASIGLLSLGQCFLLRHVALHPAFFRAASDSNQPQYQPETRQSLHTEKKEYTSHTGHLLPEIDEG